MTFSQVSLLFLVQLSFGGAVTLLLGDRRALGPKYAKLSGWILVALLGLAYSLCGSALFDGAAPDAARLLAGSVALGAVGLLAYASFAGWDRPRVETLCLIAGLAGCGAAVWFSVLPDNLGSLAARAASAAGSLGASPSAAQSAASGAAQTAGTAASPLLLTLASAYGSALVLGFVTWGMALGHWYLVAPGLPIAHLARLVAPLPWILAAKTLVSGLALALGWSALMGGGAGLSDMLSLHPEKAIDVVNLLARIPVGLLVPLVLAFMTRVTVAMEKTQPATGILYAMCAMVYLGDLMGKMIQGADGLAL